MKTLKHFYKIENNKLQLGSGFKVPEGFIEYIKGQEPQELLDILNREKFEKAKQLKLKELNQTRDNEVANMIVELEINNKTTPFNADETSQVRLNRAVTALGDNDTINWIDANGNIQTITKQQCLEGMKIAGMAQTKIFIYAAKLKEQVEQTSTIEELNKIVWDFKN